MASDTMASIKKVAQEMSDHVTITKKKDVNSRVDEILTKLEKQNKENQNRKSVFDLDILKERDPKPEIKRKNPKKKNSNISFDNSKVPQLYNERSPNKSDFFDRQISQYNQFQIRLNHIRKENVELEKETIYEKPKISKTSQRIAQEKLDRSKPLYLRSNDVLKEINNKREKLKRSLQETKETQNKQNRASSVKAMNRKPYDPETFEKWRLDQLNWIDKKKENIVKMQKSMQNVNGNEEPTNHPEINKRSEILARKKYEGSKIEDRVDFYLDAKHNNMKKIYDEITPDFKPTTNKEVPNYLRNVQTKVKTIGNETTNTLNNSNDLFQGGVTDFNQMSIKLTDGKDTSISKMKSKIKLPVNTVKSNKIHNKEYFHDVSDVSKINASKVQSGPYLYNLNVRDDSAWNNKENCIVLENNNYADIIGAMLSSSNEKDKKTRLSLIY